MVFEAQDDIAAETVDDLRRLHDLLRQRFLTAPPQDIETARRQYDEILAFLDDSGLGQAVLDDYENRVIEATAPAAQASGVNVSNEATFGTVADGTLNEITRQFGGTATAFRRAALSMAVDGVGYDTAIAELERELQTTRSRAESAAFTGASAISRTVSLALGEQIGEPIVYLYDGPLDGITRPFCRRFVGKAYTREALDALADHPTRGRQPTPVSAYLGGYNCRHRLVALPLASAVDRGLEIVGVSQEQIAALAADAGETEARVQATATGGRIEVANDGEAGTA